VPERSQYQLEKDAKRRAGVTFNRRDDVRDLMKSPAGKNYGNMLDLQSQAIRHGGFDKGDPRVDELKAARRQYNRKDKYNIANQMGYSPQQANEIYRQNSGVLREHARPTYKEMYPISDIAHGVVGSGGLTGMLLKGAFGKGKKAGKNFLDDLRGMGGDIFGAVGIGGAVPRDEATEEVLTNYATETFGPHLEDIEELDFTDEYEGPWPHEGMPLLPVEAGQPPLGAVDVTGDPTRRRDIVDDITVSDLDVESMPTPNYGDPGYFDWVARYYDTHNPDGTPKTDPTVIPGYKTSYVDSVVDEPTVYEAPVGPEVVPPIPFDDSGRESGIASMMKSGLNLAGRRPYEDVYRAFVESSGPSEVMVTYEDFMENYLPRIQESRGVFRAGLNSQGRR